MQYHDITTAEQLRHYCRKLGHAKTIAFDTEFVSEHTYRPVLCLIQVAADGDLAVIDPLTIGDVTPFWEAIAAPGHETIVHAGRGEVEFCLLAIGRRPAQLFDVQLAAGLAGAEYPAGLGTLVTKFLGCSSPKHETRTDWQRRPLSKRQIEYALGDARHLQPLRNEIHAILEKLGRLAWIEEEMASWLDNLERSISHERWRRVSGNTGLDARGLAVVRELFHWRETEAERRNQPPRRILRDDLIVELARRGSADPSRIQAVRGMERGDLRRRVNEMAVAVQRGLDLPEADCPPRAAREQVPELSVIGQFLFAAMGSICREAQLAPNLVGTPNDLREWIHYRMGRTRGKPGSAPQLARGWRGVRRPPVRGFAGRKALDSGGQSQVGPSAGVRRFAVVNGDAGLTIASRIRTGGDLGGLSGRYNLVMLMMSPDCYPLRHWSMATNPTLTQDMSSRTHKDKSSVGAGNALPPRIPSTGATSGWATMPALALLALAAVAAYRNSLAGALVFDDYPWIVSNQSIRRLWPIWQVLFPQNAVRFAGRPVVNLTLAVNYALGGEGVCGYHVVNLVIHILAAWALFGVVRRTLLQPCLREQFVSAATPLALVVAMLWMVHPLQTEAVSYVIQRAEALMGLFYLLTLYCMIRGASSSRSRFWYVAATAACLAGMATKEVMVTAPVIALLYDRTFLAGSFQEALRRRWGLYLAMAATWGVVILLLIVTGFYGGTTGFAVQKFTWWSYLLTQPGVLVHYLRLALWPSGLCFDYGWPPAHGVREVVLPGILILGLLALTIWALVKRPAWGFLGAWFFLILVPTSSFVPIQDAAFERRMYLSLAGVIAIATVGGWMAGHWLVRHGRISLLALRVAGGLLATFIGVMFGILTVQRNADYRSEMSLWADTAAKAPDNCRAHCNFGVTLVDSGRLDEAVAHYWKALELKPDYAEVHCNLGSAFVRLGRIEEAKSHLQAAMEIDPQLAMPHFNLALILVDSGHTDEAKVHFEKALELDPDCAKAHVGLGSILEESGCIDEAMAHYRQALKIKPDYPEAHYNFGVALAGRGRWDEAIDQYRQALELVPDFTDAHNNLANALVGSGRLDEAIAHYRRVLEIKPDFAEAHNNLGLVLVRRERLDEAIAQFQKALEIKPDFADADRNLAIALRQKARAD